MSMQSQDETEEIISTLTLTSLRGLSQSQALALITYYGNATQALADTHSPEQHWAAMLSNKSALQQARERAIEEYDFCQQHNIRVLPLTSPDYPQLLQTDEVADRPLQLFYRGTGSLNTRHILSVVGTRQITTYGKELCENLLRELSLLIPDVLIVSGLAYGVDIHAHRAALKNNLNTVAVLAHGLDRIYPQLHRNTALEMMQHGGLLTEYFTKTIPDKGNFVRRNRIVAGISAATLVIESANKGGSLITATIANSYGREVLAVPGRTFDEYSMGCNALIRSNKATLVTSAQDIVDTMGWSVPSAKKKDVQPSLFPLFTPEQEKLLDLLQTADEFTLDQLAAQTGRSISTLSDMLFALEDAEAVKRMPGNRYRICK